MAGNWIERAEVERQRLLQEKGVPPRRKERALTNLDILSQVGVSEKLAGIQRELWGGEGEIVQIDPRIESFANRQGNADIFLTYLTPWPVAILKRGETLKVAGIEMGNIDQRFVEFETKYFEGDSITGGDDMYALRFMGSDSEVVPELLSQFGPIVEPDTEDEIRQPGKIFVALPFSRHPGPHITMYSPSLIDDIEVVREFVDKTLLGYCMTVTLPDFDADKRNYEAMVEKMKPYIGKLPPRSSEEDSALFFRTRVDE